LDAVRFGLKLFGVLVAIVGVIGLGLVASPVTAQATKSAPNYYVSVGDSYSVGYQPGIGATAGYTGYVARKSRLTLANFGCAGATTSTILTTIGCSIPLPHVAGGVRYTSTTQAAAAEAFITAHRRHIGLITVSIGGNDVTACGAQANPITCVATAVTDITKNVTELAAALRAAAGPKVPLIGLTYPDVLLGDYVYPSLPATPIRIALAKVSVAAFKSIFNPALTTAYALAGGVLVDVTAATGAYTSLTKTITRKPYGTIPVAVARVCTLTWICTEGNIHATNQGYALIGKLVAARYAILRATHRRGS
jgi:lysophospholipase L1-like esterase